MKVKDFMENLIKESAEYEDLFGFNRIDLDKEIIINEDYLVSILKLCGYLNDENKGYIKNLIKDILISPNYTNGKVYEALVYAWLVEHRIIFEMQKHIEKGDCYKKSDKGYDADGFIIEDDKNGIVFDVKKFGISLPQFDILREKLYLELGMTDETSYITIEGNLGIDTHEISDKYLKKIKEVSRQLKDSGKYYDGNICISVKENIYGSIRKFDAYEWAENNENYFIYHSSQFCINRPYIIFCPYDEVIAPLISNNKYMAYIAFRSLCRRIFLNLSNKNEYIEKYDEKAISGIYLSEAVRKISAIVFMDFSKMVKVRVNVYINPIADNVISNYQINKLFQYNNALIDDFNHDNY